MSIPVVITPEAFKDIKNTLKKEEEVICLDHTSYVATLLVGMGLLQSGVYPIAKITQGFSYDEPRKKAVTA